MERSRRGGRIIESNREYKRGLSNSMVSSHTREGKDGERKGERISARANWCDGLSGSREALSCRSRWPLRYDRRFAGLCGGGNFSQFPKMEHWVSFRMDRRMPRRQTGGGGCVPGMFLLIFFRSSFGSSRVTRAPLSGGGRCTLADAPFSIREAFILRFTTHRS